MLTSIDIVGHLAAGVWISDRFICFSLADLILTLAPLGEGPKGPCGFSQIAPEVLEISL